MQSQLPLLRLLLTPCLCPGSLQAAVAADCCRCGATLQVDGGRGLTSPYDTRTMFGPGPNHQEVGQQTAPCTTYPPPAHPRSVGVASRALSCTTQCSGSVVAKSSQTHFGPPQTLGGVVASRQPRAGHQTQPAGRWFCTQNSKGHPPQPCVLIGASHRVFGVDKNKLYMLPRMLILVAEMDSAGSNYLGAAP